MSRVTISTIVLVVFGCTALSGCTYEYTLDTSQRLIGKAEIGGQYSVLRQRQIVFPNQISICIATSNNGTNDDRPRYLSRQLREVLASYVVSAKLFDQPQTSNSALNAAYRSRCDYLLYPQIVKSEDNVSSVMELDESESETLEFGFDRQWLQLTLWDVNSKQVADTTLVKGRNGLLTFLPHKPDDLMPDALSIYADNLFAMRLH